MFVGVDVGVDVGVGVLVGVCVGVFVGVAVFVGRGVGVALMRLSSVASGPDCVGVNVGVAVSSPADGVGVGCPGASGGRLSTSNIISGFTGARRGMSSGSAL